MSALKVYEYTYKSEHLFKRYREMKDLLIQKYEKKNSKKIFKKILINFIKKSFRGLV